VTLVAGAAIGSAGLGLTDRHGSSDAPRARATGAAPATAATIPVGDVRRLPKPPAGLRGTLVVYATDSCVPIGFDFARAQPTAVAGLLSGCQLWVSPAGTMLALIGHSTLISLSAIPGPAPDDTGLRYVPLNPLVTVADDGAIGICDGSAVVLWRPGRAHVTLRSVRGIRDSGERCVTGAVGSAIVRLSGDRRALVDVATGHTVRRLAEPARRSVVAIAASSDGYVAVADVADGAAEATVYGPAGNVTTERRPIGLTAGDVSKVLLARRGVAIALGTTEGWSVTSLVSGHISKQPRGATVTDVAFAPDAAAVAETTLDGVVIAGLPDLRPEGFLDIPSLAVFWLDR
jgi:hypothetical protein